MHQFREWTKKKEMFGWLQFSLGGGERLTYVAVKSISFLMQKLTTKTGILADEGMRITEWESELGIFHSSSS